MSMYEPGTFNIVDTLLKVALLGSEWVLWLLLALSVASISVIIERIVYYRRIQKSLTAFRDQLTQALYKGKIEEAKGLCEHNTSIAARIAQYGFSHSERGADSIERAMEAMTLNERPDLDRGLTLLATLGSNAPFIGLFGTVIGIIQAFGDLAANPDGGPSLVMAALSEALVATAVGLGVAIPAVVAYNTFSRFVRSYIASIEALTKLISSRAQSL